MTPRLVWTAPVRYSEIDGQQIVFNAHYLTYCDEALTAFLASLDLSVLAGEARLVRSVLSWSTSARWGDTIAVYVNGSRIGRTSFVIDFEVRSVRTAICTVESTYVRGGPDGKAVPLSPQARLALQGE